MESPPTKDSAEGTMLHKCMEELIQTYLATGKIIEQALGSVREADGFTFTIDQGHRDALRYATKFVTGIIEDENVPRELVNLESRVQIPSMWETFRPDDGPIEGQLDLDIVVTMKRMYVIDYKFGKGILVGVIGNTQLLMYALGAWLRLPEHIRDMINEIVPVIVQPRHFTGEHTFIWTIDEETIIAFRERMDAALEKILQGKFELRAGSWCRWCPVKLSCTANQQYSLTLAAPDQDFKNITDSKVTKNYLPSPQELTNDQLGAIIVKEPSLYALIKEVKAEALVRIQNGEHIPGVVKAKAQTKSRYSDENAIKAYFERNEFDAEFYLRDQLVPMTDLKKNIAAYEKEHGKLKDGYGKRAVPWSLSDYIEKPEGEDTVVVDNMHKQS